VYRHPGKPGAVTFNPDWAFEEGDAAFLIFCQRMGITAKQLLRLLEGGRQPPA